MDSLSANEAAIISQMEEGDRLMGSISEQRPHSSIVLERFHLLAELILQVVSTLPHILVRGMFVIILAWIFCLVRQAIQQL